MHVAQIVVHASTPHSTSGRMSGLKFDPPQVSPVTEVDRRRFPRFRAYIRRRIAETLPESILQGAITEVVTDAIGTLDSRSEKEAILCVDSNIDLERLLGPLKHQRIPAHLMTWKDEPRSLGVRSTTSTKSGVHIPDITVYVKNVATGQIVVAHVVEIKWRAGVAQAILNMSQAHEAQQTTDGTFVLETTFCRLFASDLQELLEKSSELANSMPHDFAPSQQPEATKVDDIGIDVAQFELLWKHFQRARAHIQSLPPAPVGASAILIPTLVDPSFEREIVRRTPLPAPREESPSGDDDTEDDGADGDVPLQRLLAQFTLDGWHVKLVSPRDFNTISNII
ncbi:hypothetical protein A1Q2_05222 [Trichosporon asahii var. asahii CBS 8904]|uniref:Uncharacterized protein n=2 Tax=Trichosporon asahii var. asahii TaxID=189963 RepID=K1VMF7_TRIAC|nr:hypothetical protein A1Q1_06445 [Trichosporon asahii var. asahii CBS 2479]EJT45213.1 hypothetical protein A1Q1_06445 [Trichosporon asahii var. asahii CBS 2479]EKD00557.1 hypothetical protein A1Q2_05222 [Trichosporon asahii var. asahii CBS 8904]